MYDPASCVFPEEGYACDGTCLNDTDADGVCDEFEVAGCTDETAENFNETATDDDGSCTYSIAGCTNPLACNFNPDATTSDGNCDFDSCVGCTLEGACNYDPTLPLPMMRPAYLPRRTIPVATAWVQRRRWRVQ